MASVGKPEKGDHLEDPGVDGRVILRWIFERLYGGYRLDQSGSGQREVAGSYKYWDESSGSLKWVKFLE